MKQLMGTQLMWQGVLLFGMFSSGSLQGMDPTESRFLQQQKDEKMGRLLGASEALEAERAKTIAALEAERAKANAATKKTQDANVKQGAVGFNIKPLPTITDATKLTQQGPKIDTSANQKEPQSTAPKSQMSTTSNETITAKSYGVGDVVKTALSVKDKVKTWYTENVVDVYKVQGKTLTQKTREQEDTRTKSILKATEKEAKTAAETTDAFKLKSSAFLKQYADKDGSPDLKGLVDTMQQSKSADQKLSELEGNLTQREKDLVESGGLKPKDFDLNEKKPKDMETFKERQAEITAKINDDIKKIKEDVQKAKDVSKELRASYDKVKTKLPKGIQERLPSLEETCDAMEKAKSAFKTKETEVIKKTVATDDDILTNEKVKEQVNKGRAAKMLAGGGAALALATLGTTIASALTGSTDTSSSQGLSEEEINAMFAQSAPTEEQVPTDDATSSVVSSDPATNQ